MCGCNVECDSGLYRQLMDRCVVLSSVVVCDGGYCVVCVVSAGEVVCDGMRWRAVATVLRVLVTVRE